MHSARRALSRTVTGLKLSSLMSLSVDIINIGTLTRNTLWEESAAKRPGHATTTLIRDGEHTILVDPSLPPDLMRHRLDERTGLSPQQIDTVFLTSFSPLHRRGLSLFAESIWFIGQVEREVVQAGLGAMMNGGPVGADEVSFEEIEAENALIERLKIAPEKLSEHVSIFPTYGATPGNMSLLVCGQRTIAIAGDAIITSGYFDNGRVWDRSSDPEQAKESFRELADIADAIVPGHDNIFYVG